VTISTIGVLGGTGFVGRHLANRLHKEGLRVRVLTRRRERHRDLLVIPTIELVQTDVYNSRSLMEALAGCEAVINLVGILNERGDDGRGFHKTHVELVDNLLNACQRQRIQRVLQMSALNASRDAPSFYLKSKGEAEQLVLGAASAGFRVTCFRPSVIFGPEDSFLNRFASLLRLAPLLPLARPQARFAPVYVADVVEAYARALELPASYGKRYDLCGPASYTLLELVDYVRRVARLRCRIIPLNDRLSSWQAIILERFPGKPLSKDNLRSLGVDSVCTEMDGLRALGIEPTPLESVAPQYLARLGARARYADYRGQGGRTR